MVKLFNQSTLLGSTTTNASGTFSITVSSPLSDGTYTFTLTATDAANNVSNSSGITFIINTNAGGGNQGGGQQGGGGQPRWWWYMVMVPKTLLYTILNKILCLYQK